MMGGGAQVSFSADQAVRAVTEKAPAAVDGSHSATSPNATVIPDRNSEPGTLASMRLTVVRRARPPQHICREGTNASQRVAISETKKPRISAGFLVIDDATCKR